MLSLFSGEELKEVVGGKDKIDWGFIRKNVVWVYFERWGGGGLNLHRQLPMPAPKRLSYLDKGISVTDIGGGEGTPTSTLSSFYHS